MFGVILGSIHQRIALGQADCLFLLHQPRASVLESIFPILQIGVDLHETLDLVNTCKFDGAFTFAYSPRENTPASIMKDQVDEDVKFERLNRLNEVVNKYSNMGNSKYLDKIVNVLVLGKSEKGEDKVMGYTENMKLVNVVGGNELIGQIVKVRITDTKSFSMDGVLTQ